MSTQQDSKQTVRRLASPASPLQFTSHSSSTAKLREPSVSGPPYRLPSRLALTSESSLDLIFKSRSYDPSSFLRIRTSVAPGLSMSSIMPGFEKSHSVTLDDDTSGSYQVHINDYLQVCIALNDSPLPLTYFRLSRYCYYYIFLKPHPKDKPNAKVLHTVNTLPQVCAALKGFARGSDQYSLNDEEEAALGSYCNKALPKLAPPPYVHRFGIRLVMLEKARVYREAAAEANPSLLWASKRNTLYPLLAHQGLFRASELAAMSSSDITFNRRSESGEPVSITFIIRDAKTSKRRRNKGEQPVNLDARPDHPTYCPVAKTFEWLRLINLIDDSYNIKERRTIWPVDPHSLDVCLIKKNLLLALREDLRAIGVPAHLLPLVTGHGLRTGGSCDLEDSGNSREHINRLGRWTSEAWRLYSHSSFETPPMVLIVSPLILPGLTLPGYEHAYSAHHEILRAMHEHTLPINTSSPPTLPSLSPMLLSRNADESQIPPPPLSSFTFRGSSLIKPRPFRRPSIPTASVNTGMDDFIYPLSDVSSCERNASEDSDTIIPSPFISNFASTSSSDLYTLLPDRLPSRPIDADPIGVRRDQRVGRGTHYKHDS